MIKKLGYIEEISFYLFAFFCCFPQKISSLFLIIYGTIFFVNIIVKFKNEGKISINCCKGTIPSWILIAFSVYSFLTIFYAENSQLVLSRIFEQRLTLLLLPFIAILQRSKIDFILFLKIFVLGNFFFIVYSYFYIFYQYWVVKEPVLHRDFLSNFTHVCCQLQYRTYACLNIVISYAAIVYLLLKREISIAVTLIYFITSFFFFILNNSRAEDIALLVVFVTLLIYTFKRNKMQTISIFVLGCSLLFLSVKIFPYSRLAQQFYKFEKIKKLSALDDPRICIWDCALDLANSSICRGLGVNNYEEKLVEEYEKRDFKQGVISKYNTHNQFLGFLLEFGLVGSILLLILLLSIYFVSEKERRLFYFQLTGILIISFFFENMLDRYAGCATLALFVLSNSFTHRTLNNKSPKNLNSVLFLLSCVVYLLFFITFYFNKNHNNACTIDYTLFSSIEDTDEKIYEFFEEKEHPSSSEGYIKAFNEIAVVRSEREERKSFQIDCLVDTSYQGEIVGVSIEDENRTSIDVEVYDMNRKGEWQTLSVNISKGSQCVVLFTITHLINPLPIKLKNPRIVNL